MTTNYGRSLDDDGEKSEHEAKVGSYYVAIRALHYLACLVSIYFTDTFASSWEFVCVGFAPFTHTTSKRSLTHVCSHARIRR